MIPGSGLHEACLVLDKELGFKYKINPSFLATRGGDLAQRMEIPLRHCTSLQDEDGNEAPPSRRMQQNEKRELHQVCQLPGSLGM